MARKPMVTRTVKITTANCLVVDISKNEVENMTTTIPRTYNNNKILEKVVREKIETDNIKLVQIIGQTTSEKRYGMSEQLFIETAQEISKDTTEEQTETE